MKNNRVIYIAILLAIAALSATGLALVNTSASFPVKTGVTAKTTAEGCANNPGPYITLSGEMALSGVNGRLIFRNNVIGTHERTEDTVVDVVLVPEGESIKFNKQPSLGGVGGNPWIYLQFFDGNWKAVSENMLLGRCVQGLKLADFAFDMPSDASVDVSGSCYNHPGTDISLNGELKLSGLNARMTFKNNEKGTHEYGEDIKVDFVIIPAGESISFAKQPPLGGVGGNPRIYFQFTNSDGDELSKEMYLGRCVQLE